jgi:hypothetical protein
LAEMLRAVKDSDADAGLRSSRRLVQSIKRSSSEMRP